MWLVSFIVDILYWCYRLFKSMADTARDIPVIGNWCADKFEDIAWYIYGIRDEVAKIGYWFEDVSSYLQDILSWDAIYERIRLYFFAGLQPWDWVAGYFWDFIYTYFPWLRDPAFSIWEMIRDKVGDLIPIDIPTWDTVASWFWGFVDTYLPWLRDPKSSVTDWIWDYVDTYLPWLRDPEITVGDWAEDKITDRFPIIKDLDFDPIGWLTERMADALGAFLGVAAWPFLHVVEGFLERLWDEESEEGV